VAIVGVATGLLYDGWLKATAWSWLPFALGVLSVALTYALARRMFDARAGLLAAALMAVSFWPIMYARFGLRHIGIVPLMLGVFLLLWPGFTAEHAEGAEKKNDLRLLRALGDKILAGVLLAAALMTYFAGRALPVMLVGFLVYLLVFHRSVLRRVWPGIIGAIAIGALLAVPMFIEIRNTPGAEKRTEVVGGPLIAATRGDFQPALDTTLGTLGMFTFSGDPESLYNVSGRPVFDGLTGSFFYLGVLLCAVRVRRIESGFALVWLLVGIAPAFVSLPAASFSHTIAAQPVVYMLAALGIIAVSDRVTRWQGDRQAFLSPIRLVILSLVVFNAFLALRDYFGAWANDPFVRFQYHAPTRDIARWLDQNPQVTDVAIGTHPNELWLDPLALQLDLRREDVKARWFNPEAALVVPVRGFVLFSAMQPPDREVESLARDSSPEPAQEVLSWSGAESFTFYRTTHPGEPIKLGADFGAVGLIERQAVFQATSPGAQVTQQTNWQILDSISARRLKLFMHVLDETNSVVAGIDREDVNVATLRPGDLLLQFSRFTLPGTLTPGRYQVEVGWYNPETGERLRLTDGADRVVIGSLAVTAP